VFRLGNPRHDTGNLAVKIVFFLSHREGDALVHPHDRKMSGDWKELRVDFYYSFSVTKRIDSLPMISSALSN
jgi:hypothetical protein